MTPLTSISLQLLNARLHDLGLDGPSTETIGTQGNHPYRHPYAAAGQSDPDDPFFEDSPPESIVTPPHEPDQNYLSPPDDRSNPLRRFPTVHEIHPEDSVSMVNPTKYYHPRAPVVPPKPAERGTVRQGGTDVDRDAPEYGDEVSFDGLTNRTPRTNADYLDQPTAAATSNWGGATL